MQKFSSSTILHLHSNSNSIRRGDQFRLIRVVHGRRRWRRRYSVAVEPKNVLGWLYWMRVWVYPQIRLFDYVASEIA